MLISAKQARELVDSTDKAVESFLESLSYKITDLSKEGISSLVVDDKRMFVKLKEDNPYNGKIYYPYTRFQTTVIDKLIELGFKIDWQDISSYVRMKISW